MWHVTVYAFKSFRKTNECNYASKGLIRYLEFSIKRYNWRNKILGWCLFLWNNIFLIIFFTVFFSFYSFIPMFTLMQCFSDLLENKVSYFCMMKLSDKFIFQLYTFLRSLLKYYRTIKKVRFLHASKWTCIDGSVQF